MPYVDQAAPDLAAALRGPVGKRLLAGDDGEGKFDLDEIVEVLGTSIRPWTPGAGPRSKRKHSTAWLLLTVRAKPCLVVVTTSTSTFNPTTGSYDDIEQFLVSSSKTTEPGRCRVIEVRDPDGDPFRPFLFRLGSPCWYPESILGPGVIDDAVYAEIERRPASPTGMVIDGVRNPDLSAPAEFLQLNGLPSMGRTLDAASTYKINGHKIPAARIVMRRLRREKRPAEFHGVLHVAVSRPAIKIHEADTLERALELVPDHAASLASNLSAP